MLLAAGLDGRYRYHAEPGARAACPSCEATVIAKCGDVKVWHWAHESGADCDPWSEPMTEWHADWQESVPERQREWVIENHRADILTVLNKSMPGLDTSEFSGMMTGAPLVVEFQHSHLPPEDIAERESFYGNRARQMIWVWDCRRAHTENRLYLADSRGTASYFTLRKRSFVWRWFHSTLSYCAFPVFLDLGTEELLLVSTWPKMEKSHVDFFIRDGRGETGAGVQRRWGQGTCYPVSKRALRLALPVTAEDGLA